MNVTSILADLRQRNIMVRMKGDDLSVVAEKGVLSPEIRAMLVTHKQTIVSYLRRLEQTKASEIQVVDRSSPLVLSSGQQRLWFLAQLEPASSAYVIPAAVRISGPLQPALLNQALGKITARHEALRTVFKTEDGQPRQVILDEIAVPFSFTDLRQNSLADQEARLEECIHHEISKPFDLSAGPLLRAAVLQLGDQEHVLLLALHHIAADGWSIPVLVRELSTFYAASQEGPPADLPQLRVQYVDYAAWQHRWSESVARSHQLAYWEQQLANLAPLMLPTDHPRSEHRSPRGATASFIIPATLANRLRLLGLEEEATPFMVFLAAFKVLLGRYSGQNQIAVGTPVANRERREIEGLIGFFVNTLVLFTEANQSSSFRDFLLLVKKTMLDALENQELPFEQLVDHLRPERTPDQNPLFQVMFILENTPRSALRLGDVTLQPFEIDTLTAKFDLTLSLMPEEKQLQGRLNYNRELFEPATIQRMIRHYQVLLEGIVEQLDQPDQSIAELSVLTKAERRQLLFEWNATAVEFPGKSIGELFQAQAEQTPAAVAVEYADQQLNYAELNGRANQLARYLRKLGVRPETRVGICMDRSLEMVVAILGILKAGGAYVPLDPNYPQERLCYMLKDVELKVLLAGSGVDERIPTTPNVTVIELNREWSRISEESTSNLESWTDPENLAYVIYTSGSTGKPKGIGIPHRAVVRLVKETNYADLNSDEVMLQMAPISFDASTLELWGSLLNGGKLVVLEAGLPSLERLGQVLQQKKITTLWLTAGIFHAMVEEQVESLSGVRHVLTGGDVLSPRHVEKFLEGGGLKRWLTNGYGPTENTTFTSCHRLAEYRGDGRTVAIGRPIANTQVYVLDGNMHPVAIGIVGELYIGGHGLARGYAGRPELTAEKFVPHPFSQIGGERLYRSGDLCRWRESGEIEFVGRVDHQVKIRGFRIELGEIETILGEHPSVAQVVVVAQEERGGGKRLVAYFVAAGQEKIRSDELRSYLKERLPDYMVPALFVELAQLPLTSNGKVDRGLLPSPKLEKSEEYYVGPRTPTEEILCGIWRQVLGVERIGTGDNFFELGGQSLLATQLVSRVRRTFSFELPLRALFEAPTIAGLAERIDHGRLSAKDEPIPAMQRVQRKQHLPLSFAQQRLWFIDQLEPGNTAYNVPLAMRISGNLNREAVHWAVQEIVNRQEVLRTRFPQRDGVPTQEIESDVELKVEEIDLTNVDESRKDQEAAKTAAEEAGIHFDLARGPLVRVKLLRLAEQEHILLVTMHHIVSDGWSLTIMVKEFRQLYEARCKGERGVLPELPIQYADFSMWQRNWLQGAVLEKELGYWRQRLGGVPALELLTDRRRPAVMSQAGSGISFTLGRERLEGLQRFSREQGTTLYMTCLAAWQVLLYRYTGQEDIAVGSPIAGRKWTETEGLIGFFVNTLVLRCAVNGRQSFTDLLRQIREITLEAYAHQDVPFEKVVEELEPERDLSRTPLFQVMFMLQRRPLLEMELAEIKLTPFNVDSRTTKFDLSLGLTEQEEGLHGSLSYRRDLFEAETVQRMVNHYWMLLASIVERPEDVIQMLPMLQESERQQLLEEWNRTAARYPKETVIELFELQADKTPEARAVEYERECLTYAELNGRANQLGRHLRKLGVGPDVLVGLCAQRSIELIVGMLGVLKAGGAYVPLDPDYPAERLTYMLNEADATVLLRQAALRSASPEFNGKVVNLDHHWNEISLHTTDNLIHQISGQNLAYVIYTSGSTGRPKGIGISHESLANHMRWMQNEFHYGSRDRILQKTSTSFDASVWEFYAPLLSGGQLVLLRAGGHLDPEYLASQIAEAGITVVQMVPSLLEAVLQTLPARVAGSTERSRLRLVMCGGEVLQVEQTNLVRKHWGAEVVNLYGPTECTIDATFWRTAREWDEEGIPIGKPVANTQVYVLDGEMQPVPVGVAGELFIGGIALARGYLNRPELAAERFVPNPFLTNDGGDQESSKPEGGRLYRTGDRVRWRADGNLEYLGRLDEQIKIRGLRIELGEIEAVLKDHPGVAKAVVVVHEGPGADKRLVAYVVREPECEEVGLNREKLREELRRILPEYMVPGVIVELQSLPLTSSGKIDRRALARISPAEHQDKKAYVAPRTAREEIVAKIWAELLQVDRVGIYDNFFELGGHSLLAIQAIARMRSSLGLEPPVRALFEEPTIARLVAKFGDENTVAKSLTASPIRRCSREGPIPLSFAQQRLWFLDHLEPGNRVYHIPLTVHLTGKLDERAFSAALDEIVRRHEILRTSFPVAEGRPCQMISPPAPVAVEKIDLRDVPGSREETLRFLTEQQMQKPFDLTQGPLFRVALYTLGLQEYVLCLIIHHIICDAWSVPVLVRELRILYDTFLNHGTSSLPELPLQYADVAAWEQEWLRNDVLAVEVQYWREKLEGCPQILSLPTDFPRPLVQSFDAGTRTLILSPELWSKMKRVCQRLRCTEFTALLALMNVWLFRYSGQSDILIGTPVSNRNQLETEPLIGFFLNTLVFRARIDAEARFVQLVHEVRANALDAYDHQALPFEKLVDELQVVRDPRRNPLFQVMFNMGSEVTEKLEFAGLVEGEAILPNALQARLDIHLNARPASAGLELTLTYHCGLFQPSTIASMLESFAELVRLAVENPDIVISDLVAKVVHFEQEQTLARKRSHSREQGQQLRLARRRAAVSKPN